MHKNVLIISTSLRNNANSDILAKEFHDGAVSAGNKAEIVSLKDKDINFCKGCLACQKVGHCIINDDANEITEKMRVSDVIVWATPIYYYEMSGQMKTLIDRANSLYSSDYKFKEVYVITTSSDNSEGVIQAVIHGINGWVECFHNVKIAGVLQAGGLDNPKDVLTRKELLEKAFEMGKNV